MKESLTGAERMIRHGEIRQLREAKRNHEKEVNNFLRLDTELKLV